MRVLIAGTGGVGGYYGARLADAGNDVWFLARGAKLAALRDEGLELRSDQGDVRLPDVHATDDAADAGRVDAVLFTVKAYDNEAMAGAIEAAVGPGTSITSLQNGVENEAFLSERFPQAVVLGGVARIEAWFERPGVFVQRGPQTNLTVGAFRAQDRPAAEALAVAFASTNVPFQVTDDIRAALWLKLTGICCVGGVTAYCRCPIGEARADERLAPLMADVIEEVAAVAEARDIGLAPDTAASVLRYVDEFLDPRLKSSMCRDVEAGRPLEVHWLNGAIVRFGREAGIATPANATILDALLPLHEAAMARRGQAEAPSSTT
jgi:2-dehydropantoate 2-reductase